MNSDSVIIEISNDQNTANDSPTEPGNIEATIFVEQATEDQTSAAGNVVDTTKEKSDNGKSQNHVEVDMDYVKAKEPLVTKKSTKEVLLIDIYGAQNPETGYTVTGVPDDRPSVHRSRHSRRYRVRQQTYFMNADNSGEDGGGFDYESADPATRNVFIQKVFGLVFLMLLVTAGFIALAYNSEDVRNVFRGQSLKIPALIAAGLLFILSCTVTSDCARVPPCNFVVLFLTVLAMSFLGAVVTARYTAISVLVAVLITATVVLLCLLLACTNFDFTQFLIYVIAGFAVLALCSIAYLVLQLCGVHVPGMHLALLVIGTLLQVFMLIMELQMILGGKAAELSENDYALGAFMLYTSIMQLFLNLLQLTGQID